MWFTGYLEDTSEAYTFVANGLPRIFVTLPQSGQTFEIGGRKWLTIICNIQSPIGSFVFLYDYRYPRRLFGLLFLGENIMSILKEFDNKSTMILMFNLFSQIMKTPVMCGAIGQSIQKGPDLTGRFLKHVTSIFIFMQQVTPLVHSVNSDTYLECH